MKYTALTLIALLAAGSATAQSLVELADKEKKRRESRTEEEPVKEYTDVNGDIIASDGPEDDETDEPDEREPSKKGATKSDAPEDSVEWKSIHGKYNVRYLYFQGVMRQLEGRADRWCGAAPDGTPPTDWAEEQAKRRKRCQEIRNEQTELRGEMRALESEVLAEAKRLGVRAGEARLGR